MKGTLGEINEEMELKNNKFLRDLRVHASRSQLADSSQLHCESSSENQVAEHICEKICEYMLADHNSQIPLRRPCYIILRDNTSRTRLREHFARPFSQSLLANLLQTDVRDSTAST